MSFLGLSSNQVLQTLQLNSWTLVYMIPGSKLSDDVYRISTIENYLRLCEGIYKMALLSCTFKRVENYQMFGFVALQIEGMWLRGRILSYNQFSNNNTMIELIDTGSIVNKSISELYHLPEELRYDPLCIFIKSVNGFPKIDRFFVKPLLEKSELHKGFVLVEIKEVDNFYDLCCTKALRFSQINLSDKVLSKNDRNGVGKSQEKLFLEKFGNDEHENDLPRTCSSKQLVCHNSHDSLSNNNNYKTPFYTNGTTGISILSLKEDLVLEYTNVLKKALHLNKDNDIKAVMGINDFGKNIFVKFYSELPLLTSLSLDNVKPVGKDIVYKLNKIKSPPTKLFLTANNLPENDSMKIVSQNIISNKAIVEFCFGENIDFVYVRLIEQKKKYDNIMKKFYSFYQQIFSGCTFCRLSAREAVKSKVDVNDFCELFILHKSRHNQMSANINNNFFIHFVERSYKTKHNPASGDLVAAYLPYYKEIHRALILNRNTTNSKLYLCYFVDIGCKQYIFSKMLYELLEEAKSVPYLAHKVGLKGMKQLKISTHLKYLKQYFNQIYEKPLIIEYDEYDKNGLNNVTLKTVAGNVNICNDINNFLQDQIKKKENIVHVDKQITMLNATESNNVIKSGSLIAITHFDDIKQIFVRTISHENEYHYNSLMTKMQKYYNNKKDLIPRKNPKVGERLGVKSQSGNIIQRGIVCQQISDDCFLIFYMDIGSRVCVKANDLFVLPYDLRYQWPYSVIKIGLNITLPNNYIPEKLAGYFNMLILSTTPLIVVFDEHDPFGYRNVSLKIHSNGIDISQDIIHYLSIV